MIRKLLAQLLLFVLLFGTWYELALFNTKTTSGRITGPLSTFPEIQIELLKSRNKSDAEITLQKIARSLVTYAAPQLASEVWETDCLFLDLVPGQGEEVAISLSLKPDRGILVILQKQRNNYVLLYLLDNLLPITKLDQLEIEEDWKLLVTREDHEEKLGAYSEVRTVKIWHWYKDCLYLVWSDNSFWVVNWLNTWQNPEISPKKWLRLVQDVGISFHPQPRPTILLKGQQSYLEAPAEKETLPPEYEFTLRKQRQIESLYHWDETWHRFVLDTGTLKKPGEPPQKVAVLMDMENHLESLLDHDKKQYQILDQSGKNLLVEKHYLELDPNE